MDVENSGMSEHSIGHFILRGIVDLCATAISMIRNVR